MCLTDFKREIVEKFFWRFLNMNKTELVVSIAEKAAISKKDAEKALSAFLDTVAEELKKGEKIQLVGFGTFEVRERAADQADY